jgi:uncharacterized membrane protein HdeD (DUF308 family)
VLWKPAESIVALTMLVAFFLLVGGKFRIVGGIAGRVPGGGWLVLHGLIDVLLAALIIADFQNSSYYVLGVFLSVSLLVDGVALVMTLGSVAHRGLGRIVGFGSTSGTPTAPRPA